MRSRRFLRVAAVAALAGLAFGAIRGYQDRQDRQSLALARREIAMGRVGAALSRLGPLAAKFPNDGETNYLYGLCLLARGRETAALDAWRKVPPSGPFAGLARLRTATLEQRRGRLSAAEALLTESLTHPGPHEAEARDVLIRMLRLQGRAGEARRLFLKGADWAADPVRVLRDVDRLDREPFPTEGAAQYFARASGLAPDDDRVILGMAHLATIAGRFEDADRLLRRCEAARPDDGPVARARMEWALASDRPDVVVDLLGRVRAELDPQREAAALVTWLAARGAVRTTEAEALAAQLAVDPANLAVHERLAEIAATEGRLSDAARLRAARDSFQRQRDRYADRIARADPRRDASELAGLAESLGRSVEAAVWSHLAAERPIAPRTEIALPSRTFADFIPAGSLIRDLPVGGGRESRGPSALRFTDEAASSGLVFEHESGRMEGRIVPPVAMSGGVAILDYDADGRLDVYCVQGGEYPPSKGRAAFGDRLFRNRGDGTFDDVTARAGLARLPGGYGHGVAVGDIDNDGFPDLFITRWRAYALYHNRGDGTFEEITERAGLGGDRDWPTSAAFADLDNDGDLDLYVCHYFVWDEDDPRLCADPADPSRYRCGPRDFPALPDHLFRNDGGRFVDVTTEAGITDRDGRGLGVVAADLNDDGLVDVYVANDMSANYLFWNRGGFRFEEGAAAAGAAANAEGGYQAGMGVACGDIDGDGLPELAVTNYYGESTTLFQGLGGGQFADRTAAAGLAVPSKYVLGFGAAFLDADNDGRLDLLTANGHIHDGRPQFPYEMPLQLFRGLACSRFSDASRAAGPALEVPRLGRGLAVGDLDDDGRQDALVVAQGGALIYLHNASRPGHFLSLELHGRRSNRDGVGARVVVNAGGRRRYAQRIGGGSYQSASAPGLHFGLGTATVVESVEVQWPAGATDRFEGLSADRRYVLREGDSTAVVRRRSSSR